MPRERARHAETGGPDEPGTSGGGWSTPGILALLGAVAALGLSIGYIADFHSGGAGLQHVTDVVWISDTGHPLQARRQRPERVPGRADHAAVRRRDAGREPALVGAPAALLLPLHARRVRRARRLPRPGPRAVRRVLRPDADPLLLPDRRLGREPGPGESDDQARDLHARRLAVDARRRDRDRRAGLRTGRRAHHVRAHLAAGAAAEQGLAGVDLPVLRRRVPREDARVPAARLDARRLPRDADRGADGVLRRALEGRRLRLPARSCCRCSRRPPRTSRC